MIFENTEHLKRHIDILNKSDAEFSSHLMELYPNLFDKDENGNPLIPSSGIYCPVGWRDMVDKLCYCLSSYCEHHKDTVFLNEKRTRFLEKVYNNTIVKLHNAIYKLADPYKQYKSEQDKARVFWIIPTNLAELVKEKHPIRLKIQKISSNICSKFRPKYKWVYRSVEPIRILQIKEKFGTLRFYYSGGDDQTKGMIYMVEMLSSNTCEKTGKNGTLCNKRGWYKTLCEDEAKKLDFESIK